MKGYAVVYVARSNIDSQNKVVFIASGMRFVGETFLVFTFMKYTAFRVGIRYGYGFCLRGFFSVVFERLFAMFFPVSIYFFRQFFGIAFGLYRYDLFVELFFRLALAFIWVPSINIASLLINLAFAASCSIHLKMFSMVSALNLCLKL